MNSLRVTADSQWHTRELPHFCFLVMSIKKSVLFLNSHKISLCGCYVYVCSHTGVPSMSLGPAWEWLQCVAVQLLVPEVQCYFNRCYHRVDRPLALGVGFPCSNRSGLIVYTWALFNAKECWKKHQVCWPLARGPWRNCWKYPRKDCMLSALLCGS